MLCLFDIDGTILLAGGAGARAINRVFSERFAIDGVMNDISPAGKTDPLIIEEIFAAFIDRKPADGEVLNIIETYEGYLETELSNSPRFRLMPHAAEVIEDLATRSDLLLGIATGNTERGARAKLARANLGHHFQFGGYGSDHADRAQLVATAIKRGEARAGRTVPRHNVVVIGDTPRDVAAARACQARVIAVATGGYDRTTLEATHPDATLDTLAELSAALAAL